MPLLGYDIDPAGGKLLVNEAEAAMVRTIFDVYLEKQSLRETTRELNRRGTRRKRWVTRKGVERGGEAWDKTRVAYLLRNHVYVGKVKYRGEVYNGEHPAIVDEEVWEKVQATLGRNGANGWSWARNGGGALLRGLLRCVPCGVRMVPTYTQKGKKRYAYYLCSRTRTHGWKSCPNPSIAAGEIERLVIENIRGIGTDERLVGEAIKQARGVLDDQIKDLEGQRDAVRGDLRRLSSEMKRLAGNGRRPSARAARLVDLHEQIATAEQQADEMNGSIRDLRRQAIDEEDLRAALAQFDTVWDGLTIREQSRLLHLLIEEVAYDGAAGKVAVTFRPNGIRTLAQEGAA